MQLLYHVFRNLTNRISKYSIVIRSWFLKYHHSKTAPLLAVATNVNLLQVKILLLLDENRDNF